MLIHDHTPSRVSVRTLLPVRSDFCIMKVNAPYTFPRNHEESKHVQICRQTSQHKIGVVENFELKIKTKDELATNKPGTCILHIHLHAGRTIIHKGKKKLS